MLRAIVGALLLQLAAGGAAAEDPESAARAAVDGFFEAWNARDNVALRDAIHLPHVFLIGEGGVRVARTWEEIAVDFDELARREGWAKSTIDAAEATHVSGDQVHLELVFSRLDAEGEVYRTVPALWIMTRVDDRWGVQVRSILGGEAGGVDAEGAAAGRRAAEAYFTAWNAADDGELRKTLSFPLVSFYRGRVAVTETPADLSTDFEGLRRNEGWHHSTLDSLEVVRATDSKAHVEVTFSRHDADGSPYMTGRVLYILTRQDGDWGMQFRTGLGRVD